MCVSTHTFVSLRFNLKLSVERLLLVFMRFGSALKSVVSNIKLILVLNILHVNTFTN